ncbi:N-ethylmaleimide reductase protein [Rutstroemia sp. NJR-2017a BBW]|nr:N-ethylmaleimide reductase protein [Rutstroemia sp. NJR-2017a BBW]
MSPNQSITESTDEPVANAKFLFIAIRNPDDLKDINTKRRARSHAVKQALENKRKLRQESEFRRQKITLEDWRAIEYVANPESHCPCPHLPARLIHSRRWLWIHRDCIPCLATAAEPVFSVTDELVYHSFHTVFNAGLDDPALLNAVMLTFAFAATEGSINQEFLGYQSKAISYIRKRMSSLDRATMITTIGAILLLTGVEARLGMQFQVQIHMRAIKQARLEFIVYDRVDPRSQPYDFHRASVEKRFVLPKFFPASARIPGAVPRTKQRVG